MKRIVLMLLCMLVLTGAALAESAPAAGETPLTGTVYTRGEGYTLLYPADRLTAAGEYGHAVFVPADGSEDASFMIVMTEIPFEQMETMLSEAVGGYGEGAQVSAAEIRALESGLTVGIVQAETGGMIDRFYAISDGGSLMCVTASFPAESEYGAHFDAMAESVSFVKDTRIAAIQVEGVSEEIVETRYAGESYEIWYPAEYVTLTQQYGHDTFVPADSAEEDFSISMMIVPAEIAPGDADGLLIEATGGWGEGAQIGEITERTGESGTSIREVSVISENAVTRYTMVVGAEKALCITTTFPMEAAEGFGVRFDRMADTISFE